MHAHTPLRASPALAGSLPDCKPPPAPLGPDTAALNGSVSLPSPLWATVMKAALGAQDVGGWELCLPLGRCVCWAL